MPAPLLSVADYVAQVLALADGHERATETVTLDDAPGRVLAADLRARLAVPPFDNSAMDGFAVRRADVLTARAQSPVALEIVADLPAGSTDRPHVGPGQAARIMTGAPLPPGADAVVPVEQTVTGTFTGGGDTVRVEIVAAPSEGAHVRHAADDVSPDDVVITAGTRLTARHTSAAASVGYATLDVVRRPRVHVLSTGAELRAPGEPLAHGQIPDSNSTLLAGLARAAGAEVHRVGAVADDPAALRAALDAAAHADLIVTSGGVSAGAHDVVKELLSAPGPDGAPAVTFTKVAMQPGKPQGHGRVHGTPIVTLPGNPVSVFVSFESSCGRCSARCWARRRTHPRGGSPQRPAGAARPAAPSTSPSSSPTTASAPRRPAAPARTSSRPSPSPRLSPSSPRTSSRCVPATSSP